MVNVLDFKSVFHTDSYSELNSGHHLFGVLPSQDKPNEQSIYLHVKNIDALWASLEKKLGGIKAKGPFNLETSVGRGKDA